MIATGNHHRTPLATRAAMAPSTRILSASGSRKAPDRVVPWRRASQPSTPSVHDRTNQNATAGQVAPSRTIIAIRTGVMNTRVSVRALAGVASAEGPNPLDEVGVVAIG